MPHTVTPVRAPPRVFDDYQFAERACFCPKQITEDAYAGQVVPPTPPEAMRPDRDEEDYE